MNNTSPDDILLLKQRLSEQEALNRALLEKQADRERGIDHLQAQLDKLRRMNSAVVLNKSPAASAQIEADLNRLQTESDTLTGQVADTGRAPYRFNPEYSSQILFRVFRYTSPELGNRGQENGRIQTVLAFPPPSNTSGLPVPRNPFTTETSSARFTGSSILAIKIRSIFISSKSSTVSHSIWGRLENGKYPTLSLFFELA